MSVATEPKCSRCGATPIHEVLDGDAMCWACCKWVRAKDAARAEQSA